MSAHEATTIVDVPRARRAQRARPAAPTVLDRYRLARRLGAGAFGTVWLARDERLDRDVAVKIVPRERIVGGRFEREARAAARLSHPGIVTLYEAATDDEGAYLVSELVRGETLDQLLASGRLSDRDIVELGIALCRALAHAHAEGVVHRDVKPSNILVPDHPASSAESAKLTDFGVARVIGGDSLTRTGDVVGTAAYMAPEQAEGRDAGATADLYSLAVVLYEALTGVNPVHQCARGPRRQRLSAHLAPLRRHRRDLPRELAAGIDHALRPRPRERGSLEELERALIASHDRAGDLPGVVGAPLSLRTRRDREDADNADDADVRDDAEREEAGRGLAERLLAALASAAVAAFVCGHLLHASLLPAPLIGLLAAVTVGSFPRAGWLALTLSSAGVLAADHQAGAALLIVPAAALPAAASPLISRAWPLAAGAPALGLVGLAGAWPALAARAPSVWRRAVLAAVGWMWLLVAESLTGERLFTGGLAHGPAPAAWTDSPAIAVRDVLGPLVSPGVWLPALVWAGGAIVLPLLVRGRSLAFDTVRVTIWTAFVASATQSTIAAAPGLRHIGARGAAAGAVLAGVIALAPPAAQELRDCLRGEELGVP